MKKAKQIIAIIAIVVLVGMYLATFVAALLDNPNTMHMLAGSIGLTVLIPVILWAGFMLFGRRNDDNDPGDTHDS